MSRDRRFETSEGLPNGRIGETPQRLSIAPGRSGTSPKTTPKAKFDVESRATMRVRVEETGARDLIGLAQIGMFRAIRRSADVKPTGTRSSGPPKERK